MLTRKPAARLVQLTRYSPVLPVTGHHLWKNLLSVATAFGYDMRHLMLSWGGGLWCGALEG
jgi:hypothetical protein